MAEAAKAGRGDGGKRPGLRKELGLFEVYAVSTAGLFSAGFFMLPALVVTHAGPAAFLAYIAAGLAMLPSLLSMAELATALPRAGGPYYFLDRALGPMVGTVGGLGTWLALVFKTCFAFIGLAAYVAVVVAVFGIELPTWFYTPAAIAFAVAFAALNILGAKETTRLQNVLMVGLGVVVIYFIVQGAVHLLGRGDQLANPFKPLLTSDGRHGFGFAIGLVFLTFAGLVKLASVSEEVKHPERNIPLGLGLALASATIGNALGVLIMVEVLPPVWLNDHALTPAHTAASAFFDWLPWELGIFAVGLAGVAAFAASGNAGILGSSRYPLAMSRDQLLPAGLAKVGRFGTPTPAVVVTTAVMIVFLLTLDVTSVAELAGSFNLLVFAMLNLAVIVMRESRIESYDPGFRSPLYPWMQIAGIGLALWLIAAMGVLAVMFCLLVVFAGVLWYRLYARQRVVRGGAVFHWFELLGRQRFEGLDREFRDVMKEKGARAEDPFDDVVSRAHVLDLGPEDSFEQALRHASDILSQRVPLDADEIYTRFLDSARMGFAPIAHNAMLPHFRVPDLGEPQMVILRSRTGIAAPLSAEADEREVVHAVANIHAVFLLVSPEEDPGQHLRILAQIAGRLENEGFLELWDSARDEQQLKERLLRDERYLALRVRASGPSAELLGKALRDITWPEGTLVTMVRRDGQIFAPRGSTTLQENDRVTIIGDPRGIAELYSRYVTPRLRAGKDKKGDSMSAYSSAQADQDHPDTETP